MTAFLVRREGWYYFRSELRLRNEDIFFKKFSLGNNLVFVRDKLFKCFFLKNTFSCFSICTLKRASCQD